MRLPDAENRTCLGLSETALLDQTVDLKREPRLKSLPLRVGKAEIGENVAAALFDSDRIVLRFSCTSVVSTNLPQDAPYRLRPERLLRQPGCRGGSTLEARHAGKPSRGTRHPAPPRSTNPGLCYRCSSALIGGLPSDRHRSPRSVWWTAVLFEAAPKLDTNRPLRFARRTILIVAKSRWWGKRR